LLDLDDFNINNFISNKRNNLLVAKRARLHRLLTETDPQSNSLRKAQTTRPHSTRSHAHGTPELLACHPMDGRQAPDPAGAGTALGIPRPIEVGLGRSEAPPGQIPKRAAQLAGPSSEARPRRIRDGSREVRRQAYLDAGERRPDGSSPPEQATAASREEASRPDARRDRRKREMVERDRPDTRVTRERENVR
jgi:hypothetical protein